MIFPERSGAVAVHAEDLGDGCDALWPDAGVSRKCSGHFHDGAGIVGMVVVTGEQGCSGR